MAILRCPPISDVAARVRVEASDGDRLAGRLEGEVLHPRLFTMSRIEVEPDARADDVHDAFARAVATAFAREGGDAAVWERPEDARWRAALERAGFRLAQRKEYVHRSLESDLPPGREGLSFRSLADAGRASFIARMAEASEGDPFEERRGSVRDPEREWNDLVTLAGSRFRPDRWSLVDDARGPVGVVLPQAFSEEQGTLFYVGVVPARRGQGLGTALHALGLRWLAQQGVRRYLGSTDLRNAPMRRVFARNGCSPKGVRVHLSLPPSAG